MCVHRESGAQRAVKVLRKSHMDEDEKRMLFNEINILKEIVSKNSFKEQILEEVTLKPNHLIQETRPNSLKLIITLIEFFTRAIQKRFFRKLDDANRNFIL